MLVCGHVDLTVQATHPPQKMPRRSYPSSIATSASAVMSQDPLMTYIKSQLQSKRESAMLASGSSGSRSVDLGSFMSQGSVHFDDLEIGRPCGEGSFGKVGEVQDCGAGGRHGTNCRGLIR